MIAHSFEIKIALLGNVSAGKTTVLNALFRDQVRRSLHETIHRWSQLLSHRRSYA
jgi:GTPase SAR1 family protein